MFYCYLHADLMSSSLTITTPTPGGGADGDLIMDVMADSFISLLVDLFTMLPADGCQELFATLYKVYPKPLDAKRSKEFSPSSYRYWWSPLIQQHGSTFFPKEPLMEDIEHQLVIMPSPYLMQNQTSLTISEDKRAEILQLHRTQRSVSPRHISFVEDLLQRLQEKSSPLQFQMQLLLASVSNCLHNDWARRDHRQSSMEHRHALFSLARAPETPSFGGSLQLPASDDLEFSLEALKEMWKYSIPPLKALELLEAIQDHAHSQPRAPDIMCDILTSLLDYETSLHGRVLQVMLQIGAKPECILRAASIASCSISDSRQSNNQCRATAIKCAEVLGLAYNEHKSLGAAEEMLLELRLKAMDFLQQAKSTIVDSDALEFLRQKDLATLNVQAVTQLAVDSGKQALAELLALMVLLSGESLLPTLKGMNELCNYFCKDTKDTNFPGGQSKLVTVSPFKEAIAELLDTRKEDIAKIADHGEDNDRESFLLDDLTLSFQFLGDEEGLSTYMPC